MSRLSGPLVAFVVAFLISTAFFSSMTNAKDTIVSELSSSLAWIVDELG